MKLYYSTTFSDGAIAKMGPKREIPVDPDFPILRAIRVFAELDNGDVIYLVDTQFFHSPVGLETVQVISDAIE